MSVIINHFFVLSAFLHQAKDFLLKRAYLFSMIQFLGNKRDQVGNGTKHDPRMLSNNIKIRYHDQLR